MFCRTACTGGLLQSCNLWECRGTLGKIPPKWHCRVRSLGKLIWICVFRKTEEQRERGAGVDLSSHDHGDHGCNQEDCSVQGTAENVLLRLVRWLMDKNTCQANMVTRMYERQKERSNWTKLSHTHTHHPISLQFSVSLCMCLSPPSLCLSPSVSLSFTHTHTHNNNVNRNKILII